MTKCKVIDLTPFDSGSDSDFIHASEMPFLYIPHPFLYQVSVHQVSITSSSCYKGNYFTGLVCVVVMHRSLTLTKSGRLICIARSWEFCFAILTSVRAKLFTGSSGKTFLDLSKPFSRKAC